MAVALDPFTDIVEVGWNTVTHIGVTFITELDFNPFPSGPGSHPIPGDDWAEGDICEINEGPMPWTERSSNYLVRGGVKHGTPYVSSDVTLYRSSTSTGATSAATRSGEPSGDTFVINPPVWKYMGVHPIAGRMVGSRYKPITGGTPALDQKGNQFTGFTVGTTADLELKGWQLGEEPRCYSIDHPYPVAEWLLPAGADPEEFMEKGVVIHTATVSVGGITIEYKGKTFNAWAIRPSGDQITVLCKRSDL